MKFSNYTLKEDALLQTFVCGGIKLELGEEFIAIEGNGLDLYEKDIDSLATKYFSNTGKSFPEAIEWKLESNPATSLLDYLVEEYEVDYTEKNKYTVRRNAKAISNGSGTVLDIDNKSESKIKYNPKLANKPAKHIENITTLINNSQFNPDKIRSIMSSIASNRMTTIAGPSGLGKSYLLGDIISLHDKVNYFHIKFNTNTSEAMFIQRDRVIVDKVISCAGILLEAIKSANENPDTKVYILIDELNHGDYESIIGPLWEELNNTTNASIIIGEESLTLPDNIKILATMNTVDKGLYGLGIAAHRRFNVIDLGIGDVDLSKIPDNKAKDLIKSINDIIIGSSSIEDSKTANYTMGYGVVYDYNKIFMQNINNCGEIGATVLADEYLSRKCKEHMESIKKLLKHNEEEYLYENCLEEIDKQLNINQDELQNALENTEWFK